jgi:hypothetical protein
MLIYCPQEQKEGMRLGSPSPGAVGYTSSTRSFRFSNDGMTSIPHPTINILINSLSLLGKYWVGSLKNISSLSKDPLPNPPVNFPLFPYVSRSPISLTLFWEDLVNPQVLQWILRRMQSPIK